MSGAIAVVVDKSQIRDVLERYCRGIDRLDTDLIDSVYWDDATDDHGVYTGPGPEFSAFIIPMLRETYQSTMHFLGQSATEVSGETAWAETYFVGYHIRDEEASTVVDVAGGRYVDLFEKRNGEWRIKDRTVVMDWVETRRGLENSGFSLDTFIVGQRNPSDHSYAVWQRMCKASQTN